MTPAQDQSVTVCVPVTPEGQVGHSWGRAEWVAISHVEQGHPRSWTKYHVRWNTLHDTGTEGAHHARVARFLREHEVDLVTARHMGPGMLRMVTTLLGRPMLGAHGDARRAAAVAANAAVPA